MFSITTTVSSIISPIATAKPPSDIKFSVSPVSRRNPKLITRLNGIEKRCNERGANALQKCQQHQHAHRAADEHRVANIVDRRAHQLALIVDRRDRDARRSRFSRFGQSIIQFLRNRQSVAAKSAKYGERHRVVAIAANCHAPVFVRNDDSADIPQANRLIVFDGDHAIGQFQRIDRLAVAEHLKLRRSAIQPADGFELMIFRQMVGHVGDRQPGFDQSLRIDLDRRFRADRPLAR